MAESETTDCYVCRKHRGEVSTPGGAVYEDDLFYSGHAEIREGQTQAYLGYLMLEPRRHARGVENLDPHEAARLGPLLGYLARALRESEGAERVYVFVIGEHVPHLHIHLVARYLGAPREYWGPRVDEWPAAPHGGAPEIAALCERLRGWMGQHPLL
jgi:diadenosine tetraphosphate (Ap4A) HIT family hydrolase